MKPGPKPKPFYLRVAEGNRGHRKLVPGVEPMAGPFVPAFPIDGIALQEFNRITAEAYWLRETEAVVITDRCLCFQRLLEAEEDIRQRGHVVRTRNGMTLNASIRVARAYRTALMRYDAELGLTPSARTRLADPPLPPLGSIDDPLERALCG